MRRIAGALPLASLLVGCTSPVAEPATRDEGTRAASPRPEPTPAAPSPGCGEPSAARGGLPVALRAAPAVLAQATLRAGEGVTFGDRELAVELRAAKLWLSDAPPEPQPTLVLRRGDETRALGGLGAGTTERVDDLRVRQRWTEARDAVEVRVTESSCPLDHEQLARPGADTPLWTWLSTQGLAAASFGHGHSEKLTLRLWQDSGPRLAVDHNVLDSRANLWASVGLRPGASTEITLGSAKLVVEEVLLGEATPRSSGAAVEPPAVHARVRYERAAPTWSPPFVSGAGEACGSPAPRRDPPVELLRAPSKAATHTLRADTPVTIEGVELTLELEALPEAPQGASGLGLGGGSGPRSRPIVEARRVDEDELVRRFSWLPAEVRAGGSLVRIARPLGREPAAIELRVYPLTCPSGQVAALPGENSLIWLGSHGQHQVDLADARGQRVSLELRADPDEPPRVFIATSSPSHGARSLSFTLDATAQPVVLDTGSALLLGNWDVRVIPDPEDPDAPPWYAVAIPYLPK
ncbi:MAG: hypothetical protein R3A79_18545 [Nannocystaceae bacterium]